MARIWKDIPGYEGKYQASDDGQIRRLIVGAHLTRILTQMQHPRGYLQVSLTNGSRKTYKKILVHRLVLAAFEGENPGAVGNHKDGNKQHNHIDNLEWTTQGANVEHYHNMQARRQAKAGQNSPIEF